MGVDSMVNKFVVVDLETTGSSPKKDDKIIQIGMVTIENGEITETFSSLINPGRQIPVFIESLTGISNDMVEAAPHFAEVAPKIVDMLDQACFVAHNVFFDLPFLQAELKAAGFRYFTGIVVDTVELARILYPSAWGYKLSELAEQENIVHERPHQADSDALVTAELLLIMLNQLADLPEVTLMQLIHLARGLKSDLQQLFMDELTNRSRSEDDQLETVEIINGLALRKPRILPDVCSADGGYQYPSNDIEKARLLQKALPSYVERKGQFEMMNEIFQSFQNGRHLLLEAGTGVGKSLGYLLPAVYFSKEAGERIVISTHTIQLQEQLMEIEIPRLQKILPFPLNIALLKGKHHYISLERFSQTLTDVDDNYDTTLAKMQILTWLLETETGDKDELNLSSGGQMYWNKVQTDSWPDQTGRWSGRSFYLQARDKAARADIIITNHSLLFSDLAANGAILPEYQYVIIDEGHHLEKVAANHLGKNLDYLTVRMLLGQLGLFEQKQLFYQIEKLAEAVNPRYKFTLSGSALNHLIAELLYELDEFFKLTLLLTHKNSSSKKDVKRLKLRILPDKMGRNWSVLANCAERLAFLLKDILAHMNERLEFLKASSGSLTEEQINLVVELNSLLGDLTGVRKTVCELVRTNSDAVKWIDADLRSPQNMTSIILQPASVAELLKTCFFQAKKSVIVTSATLTVNRNYQFIREELGLDRISSHEVTIPSPFDFRRQVQLLIPNDLPEINFVSEEEYVAAITEHIITIAEETKGRMLVLFTSHEMLKQTYELIKDSGFLEDFALLAQGITSGSQTRLTRNFRRYEKAILFGTSSFWEGVDIPGEDLTCLIIVRLPFTPPGEPLAEAKRELVKQRGGNAFLDYSLPEAVLRFKQGFGRLIRSETDRGIIFVFDRRIVTTNYGQAFIKSIPDIAIRNGSIHTLITAIREWLQ